MSEKISYRPLTDDLKDGPSLKSLKYFGAGAIMASVTIGSGETLFASQAGALFSYSLLWCFVGGSIMKGVQVYSAARYLTLTGEHPMTHWGFLPGPRNWVPWTIGIISLACFPFWLAGLPLMIGQTLNWILGIDANILGMSASEFGQALARLEGGDAQLAEMMAKRDQLQLAVRLWATAFVVIAVLLTWFQSYRLLEKGQLAIVGLLLVCMLAACLAIKPDWFAALAGLIPQVPKYPDWVASEYPKIAAIPEWVKVGVCLGAIGGGTYDYIGYIGCFREKKWGAIGRDIIPGETDGKCLPIDESEANIKRAKLWLWPVRIDVGVGFLCVLIFTVCFIVLGAVVLHTDHEVPSEFALLSKQARFLTDFHPALLYLYQIGIFMAFFGTIYGAYEIYLRTTYECLSPVSEKIRNMPSNTFRFRTLVYCATGGLLLIWFGPDNPTDIVAPAAIVGGVFTCGLWCFAMLWVDRRFLPKSLRMGPGLTALNWISGAVLTGLGTLAIFDYVKGLLG